MNKISVVINTYNEEHNIHNCLSSVAWADEIIIVDMYSEDRTVQIASNFPNVKIYYFENMGYADPAREFAFSKATNSWVLVLDADEMVTHRLHEKLLDVIKLDVYDIVSIPRKNYMFGEEIFCGDWRHDRICRFMRKSAVIGFNTAIHSDFYLFKNNSRFLSIVDRDMAIIHFNYTNIEHFLEKSNRYTTIDAENAFKGIKKPVTKLKIIASAFLFIPRFMLQQKGFKNKFTGFGLAVFMLNYHFSRYLKYKLMQKYNSIDTQAAIKKEYDRIAKQVLKNEP